LLTLAPAVIGRYRAGAFRRKDAERAVGCFGGVCEKPCRFRGTEGQGQVGDCRLVAWSGLVYG